MFESPAASECMVFDLPRSVTLVDHHGNVVWANPQSASIRPLPAELLVRLHGNAPTRAVRLEFDGVVVELLPTSRGTLVVAERDRGLAALAELTIQRLVFEADPARGLDKIFSTSARIGTELSGWRWSGISRYADPEGSRVELRALFDGPRLAARSLHYDTAGTPCSAVVAATGIVHFDEVEKRFPDDDSLRALGAREYVGGTYRVRGRAVGHVFLLSDRDVSVASREEAMLLVRLVSGFLGPRLQGVWPEEGLLLNPAR